MEEPNRVENRLYEPDLEKTRQPQVFDLRAPLLSQGVYHSVLAQTEALWAHIKVYASGGENELHFHPREDHLFVILDGEATFYDGEGKTKVLHRNQGLMLPRGSVYRFHSSGAQPLVMLRVGGGENLHLPWVKGGRVAADGTPTPLDHPQMTARQGVAIPGRFFGPE